jgi:hypothetical protein
MIYTMKKLRPNVKLDAMESDLTQRNWDFFRFFEGAIQTSAVRDSLYTGGRERLFSPLE